MPVSNRHNTDIGSDATFAKALRILLADPSFLADVQACSRELDRLNRAADH